MLISDIINIIESYASLDLQEKWDNSGLQLGLPSSQCTGVLVCLDPTPAVVQEAIEKGCNLIVSHHPLFFKPVKRLIGASMVETTAINAISAGICIYSSHTAADSTHGGVSAVLAERLGVKTDCVLSPLPSDPSVGLGIVGNLNEGLDASQFINLVKERLGCKAVRCTKIENNPSYIIKRVAVCGGAGGEFISDAISHGAQAYVTADVRYHDFVDFRDRILVVDAGHYETEAPIKHIFSSLIKDAFPSLPVYCTSTDDNPVSYN